MDLKEDGKFKMNPPLRDKADREALVAGIVDGTIDMIATDHAPHSEEEKSRGLEKSLMGVVGLETAFPVLYTHLVQKGILTADLPAHLREDEHILALVSMSTGFRRELILHRALSDGWLTDTGDPALGAFVRMSL